MLLNAMFLTYLHLPMYLQVSFMYVAYFANVCFYLFFVQIFKFYMQSIVFYLLLEPLQNNMLPKRSSQLVTGFWNRVVLKGF
jgi:hypothetical protein